MLYTIIFLLLETYPMQIDKCFITQQVPSKLQYFSHESEWQCFDGTNTQKIGIPGICSPEWFRRSFQSGDYGIIFPPYTSPTAHIFKGTEKIAEIPLSFNRVSFMAYQDGHLYAASMTDRNVFQLVKIDSRGTIVKSSKVTFERQRMLYADSRIFGFFHEDRLLLWVPIAQQIYRFDQQLNHTAFWPQGVPKEILTFEGTLWDEIESIPLVDREAFIKDHNGDLLRLEPMNLLLHDQKPTLVYEAMYINGVEKIDGNIKEKVNIRSLLLPLQEDDLANLLKVEGQSIMGWFGDGVQCRFPSGIHAPGPVEVYR